MKTNIFFIGVALTLSFVLTACNKDDPDYSSVTPPTVEVQPNTLSGVITNIQGQAISDAIITLGDKSVTTNTEGVYQITNVVAGTYTIKASAKGMIASESSITVEKSNHTQNLVWSVSLNKETLENINVTADEGGTGSVKSEALAGNDKAEILIAVDFADKTVPENTTVSLSPIYAETSSLITRSSRESDSKMLIGANVACSNSDITLTKPFDISFEVDETITESVEAKRYINGTWEPVEHRVENGNVIISTTEFGTFGLFFPLKISYSTSSESLSFEPSSWDNLNGSNDIQAKESVYSYKVGGEYQVKGANSLEALLIERVASIVGPTYKTISATYPLNVTLPIGTALAIRGKQKTTKVTVASRNHSASGIQYGTITVEVFTYNREHNGGAGGSTTN